MNPFEKNNPYRKYVAGVDTLIELKNGKMLREINFDNAATTPPLKTTLKAIEKFGPYYSSYHRGTGYKSQLSSALYDYSKNIVLEFIGGNPKEDIVIYVKNTTEAINKLSRIFKYRNKNTIVLSTTMEHHSNDLPWRDGYEILYVDIDKNNRLDINDLEEKLIKYQGKVKLVTVTGASNVTGYINPVYKIATLTHKYGAKILVDGAQFIPHCRFSIRDKTDPTHIDFLVFSSHKMYCPFDIGVLIGAKEDFIGTPPDHKGGGTVDVVTHKKVTWADPPYKDEAGSPNIIGAISLGATIKTLNSFSSEKILANERELKKILLYALNSIEDVIVYSDSNVEYSVGIVPFNIKDIHHVILSRILCYEFGIATRSGCFCAQPYMQRILNISEEEADSFRHKNINKPGMVRVSFGLYNTEEEVYKLIEAIKIITKNKKYYLDKYEKSNFSYF